MKTKILRPQNMFPVSFAMVLTAGLPSVGAVGPCDIYKAAGTPCVAAHSTVRILLSTYTGPLYQVRRSSDNTTKDIFPIVGETEADAASQDSFCAHTQCVITIIYDQSGKGNFVEYQGSGTSVGGDANPAVATSDSLYLGGEKVYSLYIQNGMSYWRNGDTSGMPLGSAPEGVYMVTNGKHFVNTCCFDYGNSETDRKADGGGTMDAINFSSITQWGTGAGSGPWVMADLEFGIYSQGSGGKNNPNDPTQTSTYVTALIKNNGTTQFAIKGGDATADTLGTYYNSALPPNYNPMRKQGAIVLGSGGDCCPNNFNLAAGTFYEGAIVSGYPSDATDNAIQNNIIQAGYGSKTALSVLDGNDRSARIFKTPILTMGGGMEFNSSLRGESTMNLGVFDLKGRRIANGFLSQDGQAIWNTHSLPNGVYIIKEAPGTEKGTPPNR